MLKTLQEFGFTQQDAEVYVFLALNGSKEARKITSALKIYKRQVYRILKKLKRQNLLNATTDLPAQFSVIPLDKLLDFFIRANLAEAKRIEERKDEILSLWNSSIKNYSIE